MQKITNVFIIAIILGISLVAQSQPPPNDGESSKLSIAKGIAVTAYKELLDAMEKVYNFLSDKIHGSDYSAWENLLDSIKKMRVCIEDKLVYTVAQSQPPPNDGESSKLSIAKDIAVTAYKDLLDALKDAYNFLSDKIHGPVYSDFVDGVLQGGKEDVPPTPWEDLLDSIKKMRDYIEDKLTVEAEDTHGD
ncbi:uncharacterized protein LOC126844010 [Adelges cooleyi]|uniref:uncharacterized protein LOC126844010 n=1 Tax=Adelges cooleyi TaxID=133065 RepID=UPI0021806143|nr:uncharacterized protein LOC126844010 [Adelges cooleyi]